MHWRVGPRAVDAVAMFELGPEKIMIVVAVAVMLLGPKELPMIARTLGSALRQVRAFQDTIRSELDAVLNTEADQSPSAIAPTDPAEGGSFQ